MMVETSIAFVAGVVLGFIGSIPALGPLLALIVESGARLREREGLELAIGGACAESLIALLAFLGVGELESKLGGAFVVARLLSGALLIVVGVLLFFRERLPATKRDAGARGRIGRVALGFAIVALNPGFVLMWTAIASAAQTWNSLPLTRSAAVPLAFGAGLGILGWFGLVLRVAARYGENAGLLALRRIRKTASLLVIGSGVWLTGRAVLELAARGFTLSLR